MNMKKNSTATTNNNSSYSYTRYKSGNQTIVIWDDMAKMMMGNSIPPQGCRVLKGKEGKEK